MHGGLEDRPQCGIKPDLRVELMHQPGDFFLGAKVGAR